MKCDLCKKYQMPIQDFNEKNDSNVYSKRGLLSLFRRIKGIFFKKEPPMLLCRKWITKEEALKEWPNKKQE